MKIFLQLMLYCLTTVPQVLFWSFFFGGGGVVVGVGVGGGMLGSSASFVFSSLEVAVASPNNLHHCAEVTCL